MYRWVKESMLNIVDVNKSKWWFEIIYFKENFKIIFIIVYLILWLSIFNSFDVTTYCLPTFLILWATLPFLDSSKSHLLLIHRDSLSLFACRLRPLFHFSVFVLPPGKERNTNYWTECVPPSKSFVSLSIISIFHAEFGVV